MTKLAREVLLGIIAAPLILVGGTPCQDFSVAGMRAGLAGERGALLRQRHGLEGRLCAGLP